MPVTKYNPDTGVPYQVAVNEKHYYWCDNEIDKPGYLEDFVKAKCGLDWHSSGYGEVDCVGTEIAKADPGDVASVKSDKLSQVLADVKEKLRASGYKGDVELLIVSYVG